MHILRVNITFYDTVNIIHDVITIHNPFPYTAKFMFFGVRNNETQQIRCWKIKRIRTECCRISKISNSVERNDNFLAKARKWSILSTSLDIFDIQQHYIRILYISTPYRSIVYRCQPSAFRNISTLNSSENCKSKKGNNCVKNIWIVTCPFCMGSVLIVKFNT